MRRELWENRSVYLAPLVVAAVVLVRLPDQPPFAGTDARRVDARRRRSSMPRSSSAVQLGGAPDHGRPPSSSASSIASTRCTASGAIAASCSGNRCLSPTSRPCSRRRASPRRSAADHLRAHHRYATDHAVLSTRGPARQRPERRATVDERCSPDVAGDALPPGGRARAVVRARSTAGCCWSPPGPGARLSCGPFCRWSPLVLSRRSRSIPPTSSTGWATAWRGPSLLSWPDPHACQCITSCQPIRQRS